MSRPHASVHAAVARHQVELFLQLSLSVSLLIFLGGLLVMAGDGPTRDVAIMLTISAIVFTSYLLGRTPYYRAAIVITSVVLMAIPFVYLAVQRISSPMSIYSWRSVLSALALLSPALIFSGIILPIRWLFHLGAGTAMLAAIFSTLLTESLSAGFTSFTLVAINVALIATGRIQNDRLERIRTQEIIDARDLLEHRVQERTAHLELLNSELRSARQAVQDAFQSRSEYLAEISYALRTPLTIILGYSEMLAHQAGGSSDVDGLAATDQTDAPRTALRTNGSTDPDILRRLRSLETSARYLVSLSQNMIDLDALEHGGLDFNLEPVPLHGLIEEIVQMAQPLADRSRDELTASVAPGLEQICTDPLRLKQALINLLDNACKFTLDGRVNLEVIPEVASDGAAWVAFSVTDTGIGIAPVQLKALFQPFPPSFRSTRDRYSGGGLGLAITHRICNRLGGRIEVSSKLGQGSAFTIHLPVEAST